ncbi:hypothetical protein C8D88_11699 [Lentzea atacamensis]|uniref:Uncharacterized protein n=1 Tax=Lentzea atacamensis TaxID=531938 RepID=A0A316HNV1_9PSEU|nr:hypothetical protein [Lentzea atacamensis]PWK81688.1 hypothetical protein C8D88_11699 [Lentzea atacamensis]
MTDLDAKIRSRLNLVRKDMQDHYDDAIDCVDPLFNDAGELGGAVQAVLDLHAPKAHPLDPEFKSCVGCETQVTRTDWPCVTVRALAGGMGIELDPSPEAPERSDPSPLETP